VDRKNRIVGGKMFLAKFEDDKFDNLNIEKLNIDDREFKKLASYYSKLVPFFLGKISGFNEYPIMYQLGYLKLGEN